MSNRAAIVRRSLRAHLLAGLSLSLSIVAIAAPSRADEPAPAPVTSTSTPTPTPTETSVPDASPPNDTSNPIPHLLLDDGRIPFTPPESRVLRFQIRGEYQLRFDRMQSFPLDASDGVLQAHPGATGDSLGQNTWGMHWLRMTPRFDIGDTLSFVGQLDVLTGLLFGDTAHDTFADQTPRDSMNGLSNVQPRWLYLDWLTPIGLVRLGQMPNQWGMGIVANDGDHPSLFGDYRYGSIGDGVVFGTKPLGRDGPLTTALGVQYVFRDNTADTTRGDRTVQGFLAAYLEKGPNQIGIYGVLRHQYNDRTSGDAVFPYTDTIDAGVIDVAGHFATRVPGQDAWVFGAAEIATILGSTNEERTNEQTVAGDRTSIRSYGGAAQLGVAHVAHDSAPAHEGAAPSPVEWGDLVGQIEIGYASGDADPYDGTEKRFTFDPNHKVGLLLFDEVMRFQTARAASAAQDPLLANQGRPPPGVDLLPSNGGVFGAQYVNPTAILRPRPWLDLKMGAVIAQTTADYVDPYRVVVQGAYVNYQGGNSSKHDLGLELDTGVEARFALESTRFMLGAQAGVLFPGSALEDVNGVRMQAPWIVEGRAGVLF